MDAVAVSYFLARVDQCSPFKLDLLKVPKNGYLVPRDDDVSWPTYNIDVIEVTD